MALAASTLGADLVPPSLRQLAARATQRDGWQSLRTYAQSEKNPEWRGWANFVVGYQEYESSGFNEAAADLDRAAQTDFALQDYSVFYEASALSRASKQLAAAQLLRDFTARFPSSHLRWQALELRASTLLELKTPQEAIDALTAAPEVRRRPTLALLLAQAYQQADRPTEAATTFQEIYFAFPTAPEAKTAVEALDALRTQMGAAYPESTEEIRASRAELLYRANRYEDARKEFEDLLRAQPASPLAPQWQLGRARCLLRLHRSADALEALITHFATPDLEARRLDVVVQVHAQQNDAPGIAQDLQQLEALGTATPVLADALSAAGMFYYRELDWHEAARTYERLLELFPHSDHAREDSWRLAWCYYLLHDPKATEAMRDYLAWFPDAPRAAAVLYWLGRVEEEQGSPAEARSLYNLLHKRYVHSYYARQSLTRLSSLRPEKGKDHVESDPDTGALATRLESTLPAPAVSPGLACLANTPSDSTRPVLILESLGLKALAQGYVKEALAEAPIPADLRLLLTQMEAEQGDTSDALFDAIRITPAYPQLAFSELPKDFWGVLYPQAYGKLILRQARINRLDPNLVLGIVRQESAFNPKALSTADARGLMQILPETAAHSHRPSSLRSAGRRLYDPAYNVRVGCAYLRGLMKMFDNRPEYAVAAYHAGDFRVRDWVGKYNFPDAATFLESIPIPATRAYVEAVLRDAGVYRELAAGTAHFAVCTGAKPSLESHPAGAAGKKGHTAPTKHRPAS